MQTTSQNYILYRTVDFTDQPPAYVGVDGKTVTPDPITLSPKGAVVATQQLFGTDGVVFPAGFAYALDAEGKYPVGSTYTPTE